MTRCRQARRWMERAFDGRLEVDAQFLLEEHCEHCARCRDEYGAQALLLDSLARLDEPPAERLDLERAVAAIDGRLDSGAAPAPAVRTWGRRVGVAAALLVTVGLALLVRSGRTERTEEPERVARDDGAAPSPRDPAPSLSPTVVVHPLLPSDPSEPGLDVDRRASVHERVRDALAAAARAHLGQEPDVAAFVLAFDERTADLDAADWPVARLVAGLIEDGDPLVARAACRYTGRRASRLGIARLEDALAGPAKVAATRALTDAGSRGHGGLARALWDPELMGIALEFARGLDEASRLDWAREALERAPDDFGARLAGAGAWIDLVAGSGPAGARELFDRLADARLQRGEVLNALAATGRGEALLVARLGRRVQPREVPALLDAIEHLRPAEGFAFLREQAWSGTERARAADVLARYAGVTPLYALLELDEAGRLGADELAGAWRAAFDAHPDRAITIAVEHVDRASRMACRRLLEGLALSQHTAAVPALIELAARGSLGDDDRERALLLVGELGGAGHVPLLRDTFSAFGSRDRDRAAACLLALHRLGGERAVAAALADASDRTRERVLALLSGELRSTTLRLRLARELEPVLSSHEALTWKNSR